MNRPSLAALLAGAVLLSLQAGQAAAHAVCGSRVFPVTLTLDDPGVADEATLPTAIWQRSGAEGGPGPVENYGFNFEYDKRVTENFGFAFNYGWSVAQVQHGSTQTGFSDLTVTAKYQTCISQDHEFMMSVGVQREFGGTGTASMGADATGFTAPTLYFGKGFGDLKVPWLRPLALTGELSYAVADRGLKIDASGNANDGNSNQWAGGLSLQYSLPYLQSQVKNIGLPDFLGRMVPLVELTWSSAASRPSQLSTTYQLAPGVAYMADTYEIGVEALIPLNRATGSNVGAIAMLHLFLDDLFPNSLGKPIFN